MEAMLAGLGNRIFLMNNVHDDGPILFETRWVMSYLRGPLTRDQIKTLMSSRKQATPAAPVSQAKPLLGHSAPAIPPGIKEIFFLLERQVQSFIATACWRCDDSIRGYETRCRARPATSSCKRLFPIGFLVLSGSRSPMLLD